ncbi:uncharacterized protein BJ212DRAFT_1298626 [Suillus subaureus]|uniref:F-box domain-containing protein n=1 Tax=Suillus subaureus TaxID=48587 RepID=A0A9P7EDU6_9AGAM|nr:uncharacterized protein BJ212DRAFT_1298626 [Suillus subaureus]KAG1818542.1 hypothetical protein BJ212DRAFT_1298626 [Suillus subaureus]
MWIRLGVLHISTGSRLFFLSSVRYTRLRLCGIPMMVPFEERLANLSLADMERTSDTTLEDKDLSRQEGQGCQQPVEGIQAPFAHRSGYSFEKTVSHVSMRWRTIVISNPSLWTYISVCPEETPSFLLTRIHRSFTNVVPQLLLVQLNIILRYASRWRSLTLRFGLAESMFAFVFLYFTRYGTYLPSLESVRLYGSKMQVKPWSRALFFDEPCTPRLSTLEVANMKILSGINSCNSTITTLVLTNDIPSEIMITTFNDFTRVFASFPFLASLVTYGLVVDISSHQSFTDDHQYPSLRTLSIHRIDGARFSSLIATLALIFPGITHLNLTGPRAASSLLEAVRQVSADQIWPGLQKLVLNTFIGYEWSQINHYLETHGSGDDGDGEDRTQ